LTISEVNTAVKYNVYLRGDDILLRFRSTDRNRAELAARLLRRAGIDVEVEKEDGRDVWYVEAHTDMLTAGRKELRDALAEIVRKAVENCWVDASKAERLLKKLEEGLTLEEGWPMYHVGLAKGALEVSFASTNPDSVAREAQRFRDMGLVEGKHFTVKMPEGGRNGYMRILREGLAYAARLSVYGTEGQRDLAARFVEYILKRAEEAGKEVYEKARETIEEGMSRGSLTLKGFVKEVEVYGSRHKVKVIDGKAVEEDRDGRKLLRIKITAEVGGVRRVYTITYGRYGRNNAAKGFAYASADAPRRQRGRRREARRRDGGADRRKAEDTPEERRHHRGRVRHRTLGGLHAFRRTRRRHKEVARTGLGRARSSFYTARLRPA
jgi:hypothetical protein